MQFVCGLALNNLKGLYYSLDWKAHYAHATVVSSSKARIDSSDWEMGAAWDIAVESPEKQPKQKGPNKRGQAAKSAPDASAGSAGSGESDASGEEYQASVRSVESDDEPALETAEEHESESAEEPEDEGSIIPRTPRKRKRSGVSSPRRKATTTPRKRTLAMPTPHSKARTRRAPTAVVRPPPPPLEQAHYQALHSLPLDPWLRAMHVLHVAARPDALPCRDEEYQRVLRSVDELIEEGSGGCVCKQFVFCMRYE